MHIHLCGYSCLQFSRVGIMANGEFQCIGAQGRLKRKHGSGYRINCTISGVEIHASTVAEEAQARLSEDPIVEQIKNRMEKEFKGCKCVGEKWVGPKSYQVVFSTLIDGANDVASGGGSSESNRGYEFGALADAFEKMEDLKSAPTDMGLTDFTISQCLF